MGVAQFFSWFRNNFSSSITKLKTKQTLSDINVGIDNFLIDR